MPNTDREVWNPRSCIAEHIDDRNLSQHARDVMVLLGHIMSSDFLRVELQQQNDDFRAAQQAMKAEKKP